LPRRQARRAALVVSPKMLVNEFLTDAAALRGEAGTVVFHQMRRRPTAPLLLALIQRKTVGHRACTIAHVVILSASRGPQSRALLRYLRPRPEKKNNREGMAEMTLLDATYEFQTYGFTKDLAIPGEIDLTKRRHLVLQMRESEVQMGLYDAEGNPLTTTVWGYGVGGTGGYLGPTLLAEEGSAVTVTWQNQLPLSGHLLPVDYTLHHANPARKTIEDGYVPLVTHLHGGRTDAAFDGTPDAWYTQTDRPPSSDPGGIYGMARPSFLPR
jgi:hypothetical protein